MSNVRYRNIYLDNHCHFCTASVVLFLPLFADPAACRLIINSWKKQRLRYGIKLHGFVIMPEHIHLLVSGSGANVRKFIQYSLAEIARGVHMLLAAKSQKGDLTAQQHLATIADRANGPAAIKVWKERFRAVPLDQQKAALVKLDYIHGNPVRRGLVLDASEWPWSSHAFYSGGEALISVDPLE
ncbi:MAG: hypothetical protein Q7N50_00525 [Armatimonadota bacterium]|nr:hypothetical protein [Armatimonadota bacterium]